MCVHLKKARLHTGFDLAGLLCGCGSFHPDVLRTIKGT
jgi:hypothetical protein